MSTQDKGYPEMENPQKFKEYEELKEKYQKWYFEISSQEKYHKPLEHHLLQFIMQLIQSERESMKQRVIESLPKEKYDPDGYGYASYGFNDCREQVLEAISKL